MKPRTMLVVVLALSQIWAAKLMAQFTAPVSTVLATSDPTGTCSITASLLVFNTTSGRLWGCTGSGAWSLVSGGGSVNLPTAVYTSLTTLVIGGNLSTTAPFQINNGSGPALPPVATMTSYCTLTLSGGSDTVWISPNPNDGFLDIAYLGGGGGATIALTGSPVCHLVTGAIGYTGSAGLYSIQVTSGNWPLSIGSATLQYGGLPSTYSAGTNVTFVQSPTTGNTVISAAGGTSYPPVIPGTYYEYDNFLANSSFAGGGLLAWNNYSNSGFQSVSQETATATSLGSVQINTGASSGNDVEWLRGVSVAFKNFYTAQQFTLRTSVVGVTGDSNTTYRFSLSDSSIPGASQPNNGVYIEKAAADTSWFGVCRTASSQTRTSALASVSPGSQIAFSISFASSGSATFKTASTVAGLASASPSTISGCPSVAASMAFGVGTSTTAAKSLGIFFYDMLITGLGY